MKNTTSRIKKFLKLKIRRFKIIEVFQFVSVIFKPERIHGHFI